MSKRSVCLGHPMDLFATLDRAALAGRCINEFARKLGGHRLFAALLLEADQPPDRKRETLVLANLNRNLVSLTTDTP